MGIRLLLDTHALVWWWTDDPRLPQPARGAIADPGNTVIVSAASAWEIATKHRVGKWPEVAPIVEAFETFVLRSRFGLLPISALHARAAGMLEGLHRDPFDRMLIAQAREDDLTIVSADRIFRSYGAAVIWDT
ncbi:MAG TPA: type II toxin-antitoxin system VapC family toxin [Acetobacteraceae bacterium]|nr:type II toxin-antitoxin system VapC family toxin [Acetobacteraceae bacterium]